MKRGDPERIYQAQRAGVFRRLVDAERLSEQEAERLIAGWEHKASIEGLERGGYVYWELGWDWIAEQRGAGE